MREVTHERVVSRSAAAVANTDEGLVPRVGWTGAVPLVGATDVSIRVDGVCVAQATLVPGGASGGITGLRDEDVARTALLARVAVRPGPDEDVWLARILYDALREARLGGLTTIAAREPRFSKALDALFRPVPNARGAWVGRDVPYARSVLADLAAAGGRPIPPVLLVDEIARFLEAYFAEIWQTDWFRAVHEQRLSREAYVSTLGNMHQFVRFTTRLLGRCVAFSKDSYLRAHFARHLREEVNHELIIEQDLEALGEDVAYVTHRMSPSPGIRRFMATQESAIAFHEDPIAMLAAPLAAEGIAGRLDQRFMDALHQNVVRWGVHDPTNVTRFMSSHITFDGGEDGHFAGTMKVLERYIGDDTDLQRFLSFLDAATSAMLEGYDHWSTDLRLFSALAR